jgi:oligoendopeptidase F
MSKTTATVPLSDTTTSAPVTGAEDVRWTLDDLYPDTAALDADLAAADAGAERFAEAYRGRLSDLEPTSLAEAMETLEGIHDRLGRASTYAYLRWSTNTEDAARGALLQRVREATTQTGQRLIFFDVEWAKLDDETAARFLSAEALAPYRHYLELQRLQREHILSEGEERVLSEKAVTGRAAWNRFFDETLGAARFELRGESLTEQAVLSKLHAPDRSLRRDAALALTEGLERLSRPLTYVFNTVLADKASTDRLRHYDHWLASRNLSNEISDDAVEALVDAVTGRYDLSERFYRLKRRLLSVDELMDYDRYAPIGEAERRYGWDEARATVLDAYDAFHPRMGEIALEFFEGRWIDAPVAEGKRGGAFSHGAVPSAHPYILLNYTGRARDVQTLAHELGHGVHQYLARDQGVFHASTPLTTAETASVFGEMLVFQRLVDREEDPAARLAMLVQKIDDSMATVFRQVTMNRFEDAVHTHRRERGELTADAFAEHWMTTQRRMYGDAVTLGEHYRRWWSYIPHFVHTPGYVYAYAFGELLVLALYARYREGQDGFTEGYLDLLRAGGSDWPHVLIGRLGIDLQDPAFWHQGLSAIEDLIVEAEQAARDA